MDLANWALRTSHRNSPQGLNISSIRLFDQIRGPEIPITLRPHEFINCSHFHNILISHPFSLNEIKSHFRLIFWSETRGNAVKNAMGSLWLRKIKVEFLTVQRRARRRSMLQFVRRFEVK